MKIGFVTRYRSYRQLLPVRRALFQWCREHKHETFKITYILADYSWSEVHGEGVLQSELVVTARSRAEEYIRVGWYKIGETPDWVVWEKASTDGDGLLRQGLSLNEASQLLKVARQTLQNEPVDSEALLKGRLKEAHGADVSIWCDGHLRGSYVVEGSPLGAAVVTAATRARQDSRFKPLTEEEIARCELELHLVSDLWLPVGTNVYQATPLGTANYRLVVGGQVVAWFVPTVFNCLTLPTLGELAGRLGKKAGFTKSTVSGLLQMSMSESYRQMPSGEVEPMAGPLVLNERLELKTAVATATAYLLRNIDEQGFVTPIQSKYADYSTQFDLVRSALVALSLQQAALYATDESAEVVARRVASLVAAALSDDESLGQTQRLLTMAYLVQYYVAVGEKGRANELCASLETILSNEGPVLLRLQVMRALQLVGDYEIHFELDRVVTVFLQLATEGALTGQDLVQYAELPVLCYTAKHKELSAVLRVYDDAQAADGSYLDVQYVRGVGKIAESLAAAEVEVAQTLEWLLQYQYQPQNMHYLPTDLRAAVTGGFRHDAANTDAWVDAATHFLLAATRYLSGRSKR